MKQRKLLSSVLDRPCRLSYNDRDGGVVEVRHATQGTVLAIVPVEDIYDGTDENRFEIDV